MFCFYGFVSQFIPQAFLGVKLEMAQLAHFLPLYPPFIPLVPQSFYSVLRDKCKELCRKVLTNINICAMIRLSFNKTNKQATKMTKAETALNNHLLEQGWNNASPERVSSLLSRLEGRMAQLALADGELEDLAA